MASPSSSADEGEIVERPTARPHFKANTSATASAAAAKADHGVDSSHVDRRNRNPRGRLSRSPDRHQQQRGGAAPPSVSSYPYRGTSPRGQKRLRDSRETNGDGGDRGERGDRYERDDTPSHDSRRRDGPGPGPRTRLGVDDRRPDRGRGRELRYDDDRYDDSFYSDSRYGDSRYGDSRYGDSRYGDSRYGGSRYHDGRYGDSRYDDSGKRQRTRSRSPLSSHSSSFRGNGNRGVSDRDRDVDHNRDRDYRHDRDRGGRFDRSAYAGDRAGNRGGDLGGRAGDRGEPNGSRKQGDRDRDATTANGTARPARNVTFDNAPPEEPQQDVQENWEVPQPVDEEAEIRRRRQRREEILRKSRASTPLQTGSAVASPAAEPPKPRENTPLVDVNTPRSLCTPAVASPSSRDEAEHMDLTNDQDFMTLLGKQNGGAGGGRTGAGGAEDGPSAADYDPTVDMEEDERRDELRHGGTAPGLHGGDRRASLTAHGEDEDQELQQEQPTPADEQPKAEASGQAKKVEEEEDDDDDMFAEDFVKKKYEVPNHDAAAAAAAVGGKDAAGGVLPAAAANGGGILEGDDMQGYYKIRRGEILDGRYQIQAALGKGMFSGVARAWDISTAERREVAIKIMRNNDALRKGGYTEIAILQKLNDADAENRRHIVRFERAFEFRGHLCMAFENLSMNLREVLKKFGNNVGINLHGVRVYAYQMFVALAHMRRCSIIHADLKPDNILVNDNRSTLKICDLGTAIDRSDAASAHVEITPYLVSRFYRAPEIILGMPYDYAVDMWSIGCTLYELYTGKILFTGESNNQMLRAIMEIRGKISTKLYRRGELWRMHFDDMGGFLSQEHDKFQGKTTVKTLPVIKPTRDLRTRLLAASAGMDDAESRDLNQFHDLLDRCLSLNPDKRILPSDALKHPFFTARSGR